MQYKQGTRVNFGTAAEPNYATVERVCPQIVIVRWQDSDDKMRVPIRVFETFAAPTTEAAT